MQLPHYKWEILVTRSFTLKLSCGWRDRSVRISFDHIGALSLIPRINREYQTFQCRFRHTVVAWNIYEIQFHSTVFMDRAQLVQKILDHRNNLSYAIPSMVMSTTTQKTMATSETQSLLNGCSLSPWLVSPFRGIYFVPSWRKCYTLSVWFNATSVGCNESFWHQSNDMPQLHYRVRPGPDQLYRAISGEPIAVIQRILFETAHYTVTLVVQMGRHDVFSISFPLSFQVSIPQIRSNRDQDISMRPCPKANPLPTNMCTSYAHMQQRQGVDNTN